MSKELGALESGFLASLVGPIIAVAGGGVATILVVLIVARAWPEIRQMRTLAPEPDI